MKNKYLRMIRIIRQILREMRVPLYLHAKSKHTFSVHQHVIMLILRQYESKSYESFVQWLEATPEVVGELGLQAIPHFTTRQKAADRLGVRLLHRAVGMFAKRHCPDAILAGADATGFETRHAAPYYTWRADLRHGYCKMSAMSDMKSQLVCSVTVHRHPHDSDIRQFPELFGRMRRYAVPHTVVLDKGYDAEWVHQMIRRSGAASVIPARRYRDGSYRTRGKHRRKMRDSFDEESYGQRSKTETIFSVIKRMFGSHVSSRSHSMMTAELLYRVLAYNCHRMCVISLFFVMISMEPYLRKFLISS